MHDHRATLERMRSLTPDEETLSRLTRLFRVFGDPTRMRILYALSRGEMRVCAIGEYLGMEQSAVSHQMKVLKDTYLVKSRREGKTVYYALADDHVQSIVCQGYEHVCEDKE